VRVDPVISSAAVRSYNVGACSLLQAIFPLLGF